jgi:DNA-binding NarL/FixJ family response regulator
MRSSRRLAGVVSAGKLPYTRVMRSSVLVLEDDALVRDQVVACIDADAELGVNRACGDLASARAALPTCSASLALFDLNLPDGISIELIPLARAQGMQVLIFTVSDSDELVYGALAAGAGGYLLKAEAQSSLCEALRSLRDGGAPISPRIARRLLEHFRSTRAPEPVVPHLTPREREIAELFAQGLTYSEVGRMLGLSVNTVRQHVRNLYDKLHVSSKTEAVLAIRAFQGR